MKTLILCLSLAVPLCATFAQNRVDPKIHKLEIEQSFDRLFLEYLGLKTIKKPDVIIDGNKVSVTVTELPEPIFVTAQICDTKKQVVESKGSFYRVTNYISYAHLGNVFAYEVNFEFFDADSGEEVGAAAPNFYIATKKRQFTLQCVDDFKIKSVPDWAKTAHVISPRVYLIQDSPIPGPEKYTKEG